MMNRNIKSRHLLIVGLVIVCAGVIVGSTGNASAATFQDASADIDGVSVSAAVAMLTALLAVLVWNRRARMVIQSASGKTGLTRISRVFRRGEIAEEKDYADFLAEVRAGPASSAGAVAVPGLISKEQAVAAANAKHSAKDSLKKTFDEAPGLLVGLQKLVAKCRAEKSPLTQHEKLVEISSELTTLKSLAGLPELRPAWQLTVALEGLLKQLTRRVSETNSSTLRTIENAVALLSELCVPGVRADLAANPSIRILAVDDDPIIGSALVASIKKAFDQPDLALNGEGALALARKQRYDLITLDVMMPNMDGFEVCDKIRQIPLNRTTPVLFITTLNDFDSRTKMLAGGGNEVMGKPFLAFELTVKALDMILRDRLRNGVQAVKNPNENSSHSTPAVGWPSLMPATASEKSDVPIDLPQQPNSGGNPTGTVPTVLLPPPIFASRVPAFDGSPTALRQLSQKFLDYMQACVADMKARVAAFNDVDESAPRKEMAARLHMRLHCLSRVMDVPELRPAFELCRSMEGLFQKCANDPKHLVRTSLDAMTTALDLLNDLCRPQVRSDLAEKPAIKLLVVDDEPLARRALSGALQLAFPRPMSVESGDAALELIAEQNFDMVFADICMPVMDGFALCQKIHQNVNNRHTPVVFVTSHSDEEFRARASECGGADFIVKPFIFAEISLKALTVTLRNRLEKNKIAATKAPAPATTATTEPGIATNK
jgi:CheY-like chemotaxis protein